MIGHDQQEIWSFLDFALEGYIGPILAAHPEVCEWAAMVVLYRLLFDDWLSGKRYNFDEIVEIVISESSASLQQCLFCGCNRAYEVDDGLGGVHLINRRNTQTVYPLPEAMYSAIAEPVIGRPHAERLVELLQSSDIEQVRYGVELHQTVMPPQADRWMNSLLSLPARKELFPVDDQINQ